MNKAKQSYDWAFSFQNNSGLTIEASSSSDIKISSPELSSESFPDPITCGILNFMSALVVLNTLVTDLSKKVSKQKRDELVALLQSSEQYSPG